MNSEHKGELIPFSKELWETGEYELETRGGVKFPDAEIYDLNFPNPQRPIVGRLGDKVHLWKKNGKLASDEMSDDLLLRKKTKKVWIPAFYFEDDVFDTKEECDEYYTNHEGYKGAIEVEI